MSWWKIAFCIAGYLFAWAAVAGFYDQMHKDKDDCLDGFGFLIGAIWPLHIAWLPFRTVYRAVKVQTLAQVERAKKAAEPSVPPGTFRIGSCETCMHAEPYDDGYMTCKACKELGIARSKDGWCEKYTKKPHGKWTTQDYFMAMALEVLGYERLTTVSDGRVYTSGKNNAPLSLPDGLFCGMGPCSTVIISDITDEFVEYLKEINNE